MQSRIRTQRPRNGKEAPAPPPRTGCYYNPNAPSPPAGGEQAGHPAPDAHGAEAKAEHPAALRLPKRTTLNRMAQRLRPITPPKLRRRLPQRRPSTQP